MRACCLSHSCCSLCANSMARSTLSQDTCDMLSAIMRLANAVVAPTACTRHTSRAHDEVAHSTHPQTAATIRAAARLGLRKLDVWLCGLSTWLHVATSNVPSHMQLSKLKPCARRNAPSWVLTKAPTPIPVAKGCFLYFDCRHCCLQLLRSCLCRLCCLHCLQYLVKGLQQQSNRQSQLAYTVAAWPRPDVPTSTCLLSCLKFSIESVLSSTNHQASVIQAVLSGS